MNYLDIILLAVIGLFLIRGLARGFVKEVFALGSMVIGFYAASNLHQYLDPHLAIYMDNSGAVKALSFVIIFAAIILVSWGISKLIREFLEVTLLAWVDRGAGAVFGMLEGLIICTLLIMGVRYIAPNADVLHESKLLPLLDPAIELVADMAPDSVRQTLHDNGISLP